MPTSFTPNLRYQSLPWLVACGFATCAGAQDVAQRAISNLPHVIVSGSRTEQEKDDLPASVEVIDRATIEAQQIHDIRDAVRDLPNVSVKRAPARFGLASGNTGRDGNAGFNIRGLDGNRVLLLTDGIRAPRSYVFSANAFGRDYFDIGLIERIEIIKGPASALYGSDGLAGLVNFITREPASFLHDGKTVGGSASIGYSGDDNGWHAGITTAGKPNGIAQWLLSANLGRAHELENMGTNQSANTDRTAANPQRDSSQSLLGKLILTPDARQKHTFAFEHVNKKAHYDLLSGIAKPPLGATSVVGLHAKTDLQRDRLSWEGRMQVKHALADNLQAVISYQRAHSREYIAEDSNVAPDRVRDVTYDENTWQLGLQAGKTLRMSKDWAQTLTYGFDYARTDLTNLQTGVMPPVGEVYPLKRFPDTRETTMAFYLRDEFLSDRWSITPAIRIDSFKIDASQAGFAATAASLSDSAVSPKLGVLYRATPHWSVYGNYAAGFKAPNAFQVNNFFENVIRGYKTIPNPNLKPETSQNIEVGVRGRTGSLQFDVAVFSGNFKDLIVNDQLVGGAGVPVLDPTVFQSINIGRARISGFEFKGEFDWSRDDGKGFTMPFSYGETRGHDRSSNKPLNSIDPRKATIGLRYKTPTWSVTLDAAHHAAKKSAHVDQAEIAAATRNPAARQFITPAATTFDLGMQWRVRKDLRFHASIVNLTDKKYWMWSDVSGLAASSTLADAYTQPGRHLKVSLVMDF